MKCFNINWNVHNDKKTIRENIILWSKNLPLFTLPENLSSPHIFSGVRVVQS